MSTQTISLEWDVALLPVKQLSAGDLKCVYERGNLRYIKWGDIEIIRMIYGAVRDEQWATAPYTIQDELLDIKEDSFSISYTAIYRLNKIHYKAAFKIEGRKNTITFSMQGEALSDFQRNRIGICVLHPLACAGKKVEVHHWDGSKEESQFPRLISPHQPFKNIQQLQWEVSKQVTGTLVFEGDIFETEDQRNWSDSSYKTYSTPLELPLPVWVKKGEIVKQKVVLKVEGLAAIDALTSTPSSEEKVPFPKIGYSRSPGRPLNENEIRLLRRLPFDHYRVELKFKHPDWQQQLADAVWEAKELETKLELVAFFSANIEKETEMLMAVLEKDSEQIESLLVLQEHQATTPPALLQNLYLKIKERNSLTQIGYGTDGFFADLNRNPPQGIDYDFVSFSLNPQVHAEDTRTLIENVEAQKDAITTLKAIIDTKGIHVSPVTFKMRSQQVEATTNDSMERESVPPDSDTRQHTSFGAWWTLCTLANLGSAGHLTFYQTKGHTGLLNEENDRSEAQSPIYKMFVQIKAFAPKWIILKDKKNRSDIESIVLENEAGNRLEFVIDIQQEER